MYILLKISGVLNKTIFLLIIIGQITSIRVEIDTSRVDEEEEARLLSTIIAIAFLNNNT